MSDDREPEAPPGMVEGGWLRRKFMRYPWHFGLVIGLVTITAMRPCTRHVPDPPPVMSQLPAFALVDQDGQPFTTSSLHGKVWVAGLIFTTCPSTCPKISRAMLELQERYARGGIDVHLVSFSVDPENDTSQVLKTYAGHLGADESRWRFVTGSHDAMESLVVGGFASAMDRKQNGAGMIDIAHTTKLVLIDGAGNIRGYYSSDDPMGVDEVFHRSQHVLREMRQRNAGCGSS
jgi:protein SCO1/2